MQVKLKVVGGKHAGREIGITIPNFIIGRGEQAHLRPNSDLVSREHCSILTGNGKVIVKDLGSRNGTLVNGNLIDGEFSASPGDVLRVGKLQFEFIIDVAQPSVKKPKVTGVADAVARTRSNGQVADESITDESITDWLAQPVETSKSLTETKQFRFDETPTKMFVKSGETADKNGSVDQDDSTVGDSAEGDSSKGDEPKSGKFKKKKVKPGKLPDRPKDVAESSKGAADDVLRKFFNRR